MKKSSINFIQINRKMEEKFNKCKNLNKVIICYNLDIILVNIINYKENSNIILTFII